MTLGEKIQTYRKNKGLTQRELAEKCHLATGTIQQYELGKRKPKIEQIQNIAEALDIPVEYLFEGLTIGLMTEKDAMQIDYFISQNDKSRDYQKILFENDCIIIKKDDCYILQKLING
ncbi:MAG: helix-turn-helix domain-containing protein, partial [Lachnospiraceae bacterium]|nr:helix-turn-helix domain-containing protein [Lachnospiraceae bacterium]